ncbi:TPA: hypothetical protein ACK3PA_002723 [Burkholderia cenocepacia]
MTTTENRRADALTYQEVEALAEKHGFAISAFDYTDSNSLVDLVNDAIRAASRDLQPAAAPIDWPHVANEWADAACNGVQWLKNVRDGISTPADALVEMESNIARIRALANIHQPAPSPADERAALPQIPDLVKATAWLTVCLRTELSRLDDNTDKALDEVEAQLSCVRAITNGGIDYEAMVDARAASANETGAEGATQASEEFRQIALTELYEFQELTGCSTSDEYRAKLAAMAAEAMAIPEPDDDILRVCGWEDWLPDGYIDRGTAERRYQLIAGYILSKIAAPQPAQAGAREGLMATVIQKCIDSCAAEYLEDVTGHPEDAAYCKGINDCIDALNRLKTADWSALLAAHPGQPEPRAEVTDTQRLDWLRDETCDLRCIDVPTGGGDSDVRWVVVQHHMSKPHEREIGRSHSEDPREAIDAARTGASS